MKEYFAGNDWNTITDARASGFLRLGRISVPFISMNNEPELPPGPEIASRYKSALDELFKLYDL